jgi:hypothetical protein
MCCKFLIHAFKCEHVFVRLNYKHMSFVPMLLKYQWYLHVLFFFILKNKLNRFTYNIKRTSSNFVLFWHLLAPSNWYFLLLF